MFEKKKYQWELTRTVPFTNCGGGETKVLNCKDCGGEKRVYKHGDPDKMYMNRIDHFAMDEDAKLSRILDNFNLCGRLG